MRGESTVGDSFGAGPWDPSQSEKDHASAAENGDRNHLVHTQEDEHSGQGSSEIKASGAYPAFPLVLAISGANALLAHGWPEAKKIGAIPEGMVPGMLISEGRCLVVLLPGE
ncbi:MAG: hypothetical protein Fur0032_10130 [Terrimicrobiaceae bacterium]